MLRVSTAVLAAMVLMGARSNALAQIYDHPSPPSSGLWTPSGNDVYAANGNIDPESMTMSGPHSTLVEANQQMETDPGTFYLPKIAPEDSSKSKAGAVSVAQLRHPLNSKSYRLLQKIQNYLKTGQRAKAREPIAQALAEPAAAPYAHAIVGTDYLKHGQTAAALPELEAAAAALPISSIHSNFGYALCMSGKSSRCEQELDEALKLDGQSPVARFLMGVVLMNEKSRAREALFNLKASESQIRTAHLALAVCNVRDGEREAAEEQIHQYLGPNNADAFPLTWEWVEKTAADAHPATAFGFPDGQ